VTFRRLFLILALVSLGAGCWGLGQGGYVYAKALLAQHLLQKAWDRTLTGKQQSRPWPWADTWPVARLIVPQQETALVVLAGVSGSALAFAPGHLDGSPRPGRPGNSVIAGHRDTHFRFLQQLTSGDIIQIESTDGRVHNFEVFSLQVVDASETRLVLEGAEPLLSLVTCYPFNAVVSGGSLRYVVTARAI
jgi:sortase A